MRKTMLLHVCVSVPFVLAPVYTPAFRCVKYMLDVLAGVTQDFFVFFLFPAFPPAV